MSALTLTRNISKPQCWNTLHQIRNHGCQSPCDGMPVIEGQGQNALPPQTKLVPGLYVRKLDDLNRPNNRFTGSAP